jgi:hypothetical protein
LNTFDPPLSPETFAAFSKFHLNTSNSPNTTPCHLFSRGHDHVVETSRANHYRAPCGHRRIAPLVPTSVGWDDRCVPLSYKKGDPPAVLPLLSLACFRARHCRHSCFPLRLVFGQPATSPSLPLLRLLAGQAISPSSSTTSRRSSKKTERRTPATSPTMPQFVEMFESLRWTLVAMYLCIVGGVCLLLVFHVHIHRPLPHELR